MRKRWPAIEPHWFVLLRGGVIGKPWGYRQSAYSAAAMYRESGIRPVAIIKVTPK